jgi:hypothetical protein
MLRKQKTNDLEWCVLEFPFPAGLGTGDRWKYRTGEQIICARKTPPTGFQKLSANTRPLGSGSIEGQVRGLRQQEHWMTRLNRGSIASFRQYMFS